MTEEVKEFLRQYISQFARVQTPREMLVPLLQKSQEKFGYISEEMVNTISDFLNISRSEVFGVASFYAQFRFTPPGRHCIKVCLGTACHVRGGENLLAVLTKDLNVDVGGVTEDMRFSVERVACVGCCALAPVVVIDNDVHAKMTPVKVRESLKKYE